MPDTRAPVEERSVQISPIGILADLSIPSAAESLVVFAHGTGSSRFSSRNRFVAGVLQHRRMATLLLDLLTAEEELIDTRSRELRFDIALLAERLVQTTEWVRSDPQTASLPMGYFGASTGAGAALVAAAKLPNLIRAVVSRGGRPDLAGAVLPDVKAPTLLIVGERDQTVIELNRRALKQLRCEKALEIVPKATHLFEEPGALQEVARLASGWFERHLK